MSQLKKQKTKEQVLDEIVEDINSYLKATGSPEGYVIERSYGRQNLMQINFEEYEKRHVLLRSVRSLTKPEMYDVLICMRNALELAVRDRK